MYTNCSKTQLQTPKDHTRNGYKHRWGVESRTQHPGGVESFTQHPGGFSTAGAA